MQFQKGQPRPPNAGRKLGSKNKKKLRKIAEVLAENGIDPAQEILDILNTDDETKQLSPRVRAELWLEVLSYCEAKPKASEEASSDSDDLDDFENVSNEELLRLIKSPGAV